MAVGARSFGSRCVGLNTHLGATNTRLLRHTRAAFARCSLRPLLLTPIASYALVVYDIAVSPVLFTPAAPHVTHSRLLVAHLLTPPALTAQVSIDGGENWTLAKLTHPETPTEYGRYWCWCFFEHEIKLTDLWKLQNPEILCRGWDAAMMRQPEKLTWNVMGMMNNSYFRVKVSSSRATPSTEP